VRFSHRRLSDADVYFVYNHSPEAFSQEVSLRTPYRRLYRLDPLDGSLIALDHVAARPGGSRPPEAEKSPLREMLPSAGTAPTGSSGASLTFCLELEPDESVFLVATDLSLEIDGVQNEADLRQAVTLSGPWRVQFDPAMGGPERPVRMKELSDWTQDADPRIRYFSGTTVYTKAFRYAAGDSRTVLQLSLLNGTARVFVNGVEAGIVWCSPWRLDIGPYLKPGRNELRIEVANSLYNRMIGDAIEYPDGASGRSGSRPPEAGKTTLREKLPSAGTAPSGPYTRSSYPIVTAETPLIPSGLCSVQLLSAR
jgi:hypothetical protein